jgi:hypothetical protein
VARKKLFVSLFGTGVNNEFKYDKDDNPMSDRFCLSKP